MLFDYNKLSNELEVFKTLGEIATKLKRNDFVNVVAYATINENPVMQVKTRCNSEPVKKKDI